MISNIFNSEEEEGNDEHFSIEISVRYQRSFKTWFLIRFSLMVVLLVQVILIVYAYIRWPNYQNSPLERIIYSLTVKIPTEITFSESDRVEGIKLYSYPETKEGYECSADNNEKKCNKNLVCIDKKLYDPNFSEEEEEEEIDKYEDPDCKTISSKKPYKVVKWKGKKFGFIGTKSYIEVLRDKEYTKTGVCKENYQNCGILDSSGLNLCVSIREKCPINYIKVDNKPCSGSWCTYFIISDGEYLNVANNNINGKILGMFDISERESICADFKEKTTNRSAYILENFSYKCNNKINGYLEDQRYTFLDSDSSKNFYSQGGILNHLSDLPKINTDEIAKEGTTSLFYSNFFGFQDSCLDDAYDIYKKLNALKTGIEDQLSLSLILLILLMVGMLVFFIISGLLFFCPPFHFREYAYPVAALIYILIPFIISVILVKNTTSSSIPTNCFDPIINGNLENALKEVRYVFSLHVSNLVLTIIDIILLGLALVMICLGNDSEPLKFKTARDLDKFRILFFRHYKRIDEKKNERKEEEEIAAKEDIIKKEIEMNTITTGDLI